jgi:hypothetical protein
MNSIASNSESSVGDVGCLSVVFARKLFARRKGIVSETSEGPSSVLFTLRLWYESFGSGQGEWRGEIRNLASGETHYFRHWNEIADLIPGMLVNFAGDDGKTNPSG